jgi:dTDP-4-amino-4,6-dideoxygalactose transaminase
VPFHRPSFDQREIDAVADVLRSGWITTGERTAEFERRFAQYVGASHAVAFNSCTAALHVALAAEGIGPGDEVITTPYTFVATVEAICYLGATPVLADVDPATRNIDPA